MDYSEAHMVLSIEFLPHREYIKQNILTIV